MLVLAGCSGAPFSGTDGQTSEPTTALYLSDAPIDDFEHLNVTITKVGVTNQEFEQESEREIKHDGNASETEIEAAYEFEYETDDWNETEIEPRTVDLTEVKGDRAVRLANLTTSPGQYEAVYVEGESETEFVFDLGVEQTSDGYVLLPNAAESGTNVPFVDVEQEGENMHLRFVGDVTRGQEATIEVTDNQGNPVEGATVEVNGEDMAETNADGRATFTVPTDDDELEVIVEHETGKAHIEYDFGDSAETPETTESPEATETSEPTETAESTG